MFAISSQKLMPSTWWGYKALMALNLEQKKVSFVQNAPLSIAEIECYMDEIDYESLSESGKATYDKIIAEFKDKEFTFDAGAISLSTDPDVTPEFYYKSNENIPWTLKYNYKDNLINVPVSIDVSDLFLIESDIFLGKNYWAMQESNNWTNIPLGYNDFEFLWPKTAYFSTGLKIKDKAYANFQIGRGGLEIGQTQTGSIILSDNYETNAYIQASFSSSKFKYALDVIQTDVNKYFYLHRIDFRPFNCFQLGLVEGTFVNAPFEIRYLNPLMIMHSTTPWIGYDGYNEGQADGEAKSYGESRVCAYFAATFDYAVCKNVRIYGLYAQNELQIPAELTSTRGQEFPDSLGGQLGIEVKLPSKHDGYWIGGLEGVYTTPWLYIKHDAEWSLFSYRYDNLKNTSLPICNWVGTPFGPDSIAVQASAGFKSVHDWSCELQYLFLVQGENSFNLFFNPDGTTTQNADGKYVYYPPVMVDEGVATAEEAIDIARNQKTPTGIPQYRNSITLQGSYKFNKMITTSGKIVYSFIFNNNHVEDCFEQGIEVATSVKISFN